jgi:hypothetical protein
MYLGGPSKPPTPAEYAVLFVAASAGSIILGIAAEIIALRMDAGDHDRAVALSHYGFLFIALGVGIGVVFWLFRRLKD